MPAASTGKPRAPATKSKKQCAGAKAKAPEAAPPGMVTVFIQASVLYARPSVVKELGLAKISLGGGASIYTFPVQKERFEQARAQATAQGGNPPGFLDFVVSGFGVGLGAAAGEAVFDGVAGYFGNDD